MIETQPKASLRLRAGRIEDAERCGSICYEAFKAIADQHDFPPDFPSAEVAQGLISALLSRGDVYSIVAEVDGRIVGSNFLWENGVIAGVGRYGRDVVWSMYNHHANANGMWYEALNDTPGRVGPPIELPPGDIRQYWREWLDRDGQPFWPFWENVRTWWEFRHLPNILFVHFANLKRDMPGQMRRIAEFLDVPIDETRWEEILEDCSFDWMKRNDSKGNALGDAFWDAGAQVFINKGVNGRWAETLAPEDVAEYEVRAIHVLGPKCVRSLATGEGL